MLEGDCGGSPRATSHQFIYLAHMICPSGMSRPNFKQPLQAALPTDAA